MTPVPLSLLTQHIKKPARVSALDPPSPMDDSGDEERNYGVSYIKRESTRGRIWGVRKKTWLGRRLQKPYVRIGVVTAGTLVAFLWVEQFQYALRVQSISKSPRTPYFRGRADPSDTRRAGRTAVITSAAACYSTRKLVYTPRPIYWRALEACSSWQHHSRIDIGT